MPNKIKFFFVIGFILLPFCQANAYLKAPNPFKYNSPEELWDVASPSIETILNDWYVFANQDDFFLYEDMSSKNQVHKTSFLEKYKVIEKKSRFLFVETYDDLKIRGWGNIENFITIPHALRTANTITYKALLVNRLKPIEGNVNTVIPLRSPSPKAKSYGPEIKILEFANIYSFYPDQKDPEYLLIGKLDVFFPLAPDRYSHSVKRVLLGWVPAERVLIWNTREALQPNPKRKHPIYYFKKKDDLVSYYNNNQTDVFPSNKVIPSCEDSNNILVISPDNENTIDKKKWPFDAFRYAVIDKSNINEPFHIGISNAIPAVIQVIEGSMPTGRDVVFLVDATKSMEKYIPLAIKIAKKIMNDFREKQKIQREGIEKLDVDLPQNDLRFGIAVYRDYKCQSDVFEIIGELTCDQDNVNSYLKNIKTTICHETEGDPAYYPEALFRGIKDAAIAMNWNSKAMKQIILIGDAGNDSRNMDHLTSKKIANVLVQKNISFSAIQIINVPFNDDYESAQRSFCKDIRLIINGIASEELIKAVNFDKQELMVQETDYKLIKKEIQSIVDKTSSNTCCIHKVCCPVSKSRWSLECLNVDDSYQDQFNRQVEFQIQNLAQQLYETKDLLEKIRIKDKIIFKTDPNTPNYSFRPQLMLGILSELIHKLGANVAKEKFPNKDHSQEMIIKLGINELNEYLNEAPEFFTDAYVMYRRPGKTYKNDPDQFEKMVLFQKKEIEKLLFPLSFLEDNYQCQIHPENIKTIWIEFLKGIIGVTDSKYVDKSKSMKELYEKQYGISLRSKHPLLSISYKEICQNLTNYESETLDQLGVYLCECQDKLKNIYHNSKYFSMFGQKYLWVEASILP
ncbi:conserved hypothetical protein, secreted [Candidatus Magnetomorum sp. HK-1]|nr:conserved hypothetical protein, secreted [Candidatus Magnetomorum sp. HK-1]